MSKKVSLRRFGSRCFISIFEQFTYVLAQNLVLTRKMDTFDKSLEEIIKAKKSARGRGRGRGGQGRGARGSRGAGGRGRGGGPMRRRGGARGTPYSRVRHFTHTSL